MTLKKKLLLCLVVGLVLVFQLLNIYASEWQHSMSSAHNTPVSGSDWSQVWLVPMDTGHPHETELLADALLEKLRAGGLDAKLAPESCVLAPGEPQPVILEIAVAEWKNTWALFGRKAIARVKLQTRLYGDYTSSNNLWITSSFSGTARYRGIVQTGRVDADIANQVAYVFAKQAVEELHQDNTAYPVIPSERNGFRWSFSLKLPQWLTSVFQRSAGQSVDHPLVLDKVDYHWQFIRNGQPQEVYLYRVEMTGDELEQELLKRLQPGIGGDSFLDIDYNGYHRRTFAGGLISHWSARHEGLFGTGDPNTGAFTNASYASLQQEKLERYVLIVDPAPRDTGSISQP